MYPRTLKPQAACLARCNGARVELHRHGTFTLDQFRQQLRSACESGEEHVVVSYSRAAFLQTGDGHFSPVGGFHEDKDLALILDVVRSGSCRGCLADFSAVCLGSVSCFADKLSERKGQQTA